MKTITQPKKQEQAKPLVETTRRPLVRAEVIAEALDVHKRTVCLWAQSGTIPCHRIGATVRFDLAEVMAVAKGGRA